METAKVQVQIPNISKTEREKRLKIGGVFLLISLIGLVVLAATGISPWWRLGLFPFFMSAASGYFQWRDKT